LIADEVTTLDPYRMVTIHPEGSIARHLWDTLTVLNDELQIEPHLAESWQLVNNFTWELKLRQGISFHNGEPVNAEAVRFSIERAQSMPGSLETFAEEVGLKQINVIDDYTIRLITRKPASDLPYYLTSLEILPPLYYSETGADQVAKAPVGSGPYRLSQWQAGQALVLEAVPDYWQGAPSLPGLVFQIVSQPQERLAALRLGRADLITDLPPIPTARWNIPNSRLATVETTQRMFIGIRIVTNSPLADKRVRQALNYSINVEQIAETWLAGYGDRYGSWVNGPATHPELDPWPYDPNLARRLVAEAGYPQGFTTTLRTPIGMYEEDVNIAKAVAQQLAQVGVMVEVEAVDQNVYMEQLLSGDIAPLFLLALNSQGNGLEDIRNLSKDFTFNLTGWQNELFEEKLRQAADSHNQAAQSLFLTEAQAIAYDEAPWIWLWRSHRFYGVSQDLTWEPRPDGLIYLYKPEADLK
jgi:peptide/nickel transport system substrate-binding protein